jgi:hypothetical protein
MVALGVAGLLFACGPGAHAQSKDPFQPVPAPGAAPAEPPGGVIDSGAPGAGGPTVGLPGGGLPRTGVDVEMPLLLAGALLVAGSSLRLTARALAF